ncbi:hypothetical protein Leryth_000547 [Lithospermum erythrorhizon]|nr:hypothetical protein Leryth_000547 [Lithospermum erythrorhizon]
MDVICQAKSGMGKTAVFVLSTLQQIEPVAGQVAALVLCHTRELAYQICHEFERFSTYLPDSKVAVFYGGVNIKVHKDLLKNECPHIVVGTPGRILALGRDKDLSLRNVRHFILDECDKMLESLDMRRDVQEIFKMTPHDKQVMMFSATLSKEIRPLIAVSKELSARKHIRWVGTSSGDAQPSFIPMEIYVDDEAKLTLHGLVQHYIKLSEMEKNRKLNDLLDALDFNQVVIFVKSVSRAAELNKLLVECNFPSICIHSGMSQEERLTRYKGFKEGHKRILVATDLVGRGIDIERVNIVINYDMPDSADTYLHRVGRAGRFGTKGLAITFVSSASDSDVLNQLMDCYFNLFYILRHSLCWFQVQERFEVDIKELPEQIDTSTYSTFDPGSCQGTNGNLLCWGSVNVSTDGILNLTPENNTDNKIARVLFRFPMLAWPVTFTTTFTIRILTNSTFSGDGMAFIIAQDDKPSPPESFGSFIGILDPKTQDQENVVISGGVLHQLAVEFDTFKNEYEMDNNHVAIDTISVENPVVVKSLNTSGINLRSGRAINFKIDYDGWEKIMEIHVAYAGEPLKRFLSQRLNLQDIVPHFAYIGFTASTAHNSEVHQVLSWNFSAYELPSESLDEGVERNNTKLMLLIIIPAAVFIPLILITSAVCLAHRKKKKKVEMKQEMEMLSRDAANVPKMFTFCQLSKATHNFCKENLLGSGGFGTVFKGVIPDSPNFVAVKRINATSKQGTREYLAEICTIGRLRHKNLVQLQGWCHDHEKLLLVYEYMANGSLDRYIGKCCLDWKTRFKILSGLASALLYLHEECGNPIVHRDCTLVLLASEPHHWSLWETTSKFSVMDEVRRVDKKDV